MTPEQYQKLVDLFHRAMERLPAERESFARELCDGDLELLPDLLRLIHGASDSSETRPARFEVEGYIPAFSPNQVLLKRFRIVRFLGHGGMGEVYEADDLETGRVALKTIRSEIGGHARAIESFRHEVLCARKVTGANVCRIYEIFSLPDPDNRAATAFLTMEFLEGVTLSDRIKTNPPLSVREAQNIAVQICRGLQTIHDAGIVHRDLKSRNIMLAERERGTEAVLMDFGLARDLRAHSAFAGGARASGVRGEIAGTPEYMAPEQFHGGAATPATDIYALGVVLYEMVTRKLPFEGPGALAAAVERAKPLGLASALRKDLPHRWDTTIQRCLRYRAEDRFQSATEVARALTGPSSISVGIPEYVTRFRWLHSALALAIVAALVGLVWYRAVSTPLQGSAAARRWYEQGVAALQEGTYLKAANALQMAIDLDKNFVLAHARLADAWNELEFTGKAKDEMLQASSLESDHKLRPVERQYVDAVRQTIVGDFRAALREYRQIFDALPRNAKAEGYLDLGRAYEKSGDMDQAISAYKFAAKLNPQNPAAFLRLGILESRRKQSAEANVAFARAEQLYRASSNLEGLAEVSFQKGNDANTQHHFDEALADLESSLKLAEALHSPQLEIRALTRLSTTEYLDYKPAASIAYANRAILLSQENGIDYWGIDAMIRLANAYISESDYADAEVQCERALRLARNSQRARLVALAQVTLASVRSHQNKPRDVIALAKPALDYYRQMGFASEYVDALTLIIRAQRDTFDYPAALHSAQELLLYANKMNTPAALVPAEDTLGSVLFDMEQYPEALTHFLNALAAGKLLGSQSEYQLLHCADTYWRLGEYNEAATKLAEVPVAARSRAEIALLVSEIRSGMLLSEHHYAAASDIAERALKNKSNGDPGYFERLLGQIETESGSPSAAVEWCKQALAQANLDDDATARAAAELALANAYVAGGSANQAKAFAESAHHFFAASGKKESECLGLAALSAIAHALNDSADCKNYARKALDIFSDFEHNWSPQQYKTYSSRPDVQKIRAELTRLETKS